MPITRFGLWGDMARQVVSVHLRGTTAGSESKFMYPYLTPWEIHKELEFPPTPFTSLLGEHWGLHIHTLYLAPGGGR